MTGNEPRLRARKVSAIQRGPIGPMQVFHDQDHPSGFRKPSKERQNRFEEAGLLAYAPIGGPASVIRQEADQLCAVQPSWISLRSQRSAQLPQHGGQRQSRASHGLTQLETGTDEYARVW